jgi:catechol 2,3-dioxygenase-like lactoylglutathione lyase family enzyme
VTTSLKNVGAITLFVEDAQRSKSFYQRVFGLSLIFEDESSAALRMDNVILNLLKETEAHELIEPAAVAHGGAGSRFQFTVWVDDADAACADLAAHGVSLLNGPIDRPWGVRTAAFADPDGHVWEVAQQLQGA